MKKNYVAPEMEELKIGDPIVLDMTESSGGSIVACPTKTCDTDTCTDDMD